MAKIDFGNGLETYMTQLRDLGANIEGVCKFAVYDAAGIVADAIKAATPEDTGDLKDSLALVPFRNDNGYVYTAVEFAGYDRKGVANSLKARAYESGTSTQPKRPFIRPAVNSVKLAAELSIELNLNKKISQYMNGKE